MLVKLFQQPAADAFALYPRNSKTLLIFGIGAYFAWNCVRHFQTPRLRDPVYVNALELSTRKLEVPVTFSNFFIRHFYGSLFSYGSHFSSLKKL